ncbi:MAG: ATP-binding protein [Chloroflexi bacterium]|nr:ATP-binding protein [Chloroflexota bacterium]
MRPNQPFDSAQGKLWLAALGELQLQLTKTTFDTWLRDTLLLSHDAEVNEFTIGVETPYAKDWLENRLLSTLKRTLSAVCGRPAQLKIVLSPLAPPAETTDEEEDEPHLSLDDYDWARLGVPDIFKHETLSTLDWSQPALQKPELRDYVEHAADYFEAGIGLTLIGTPGTGKTHLTAGLLKQAVAGGYSARFAGVVPLLDRLRATFDGHRAGESEQRIIYSLIEPDVLVLDDLRVDNLTVWARDRLYAVVGGRWERGLPTLTTSNYTPEELFHPAGRDRLGLDEGTLSRLIRSALTLTIVGEDYRLERKRKKIAAIQSARAILTLCRNKP